MLEFAIASICMHTYVYMCMSISYMYIYIYIHIIYIHKIQWCFAATYGKVVWHSDENHCFSLFTFVLSLMYSSLYGWSSKSLIVPFYHCLSFFRVIYLIIYFIPWFIHKSIISFYGISLWLNSAPFVDVSHENHKFSTSMLLCRVPSPQHRSCPFLRRWHVSLRTWPTIPALRTLTRLGATGGCRLWVQLVMIQWV